MNKQRKYNGKIFKRQYKAARSLALNIALMGGPDLTKLPGRELVDRMFETCASLAISSRSAGVSAEDAATGFKLLAKAMKRKES